MLLSYIVRIYYFENLSNYRLNIVQTNQRLWLINYEIKNNKVMNEN